jgi:O-antigen ligase
MSATQVVVALTVLPVWPILLISGLLRDSDPLVLASVLTAALITALITYHAVRRAKWALITILVVAVIALSINFRTRDYGATGLDWQNGLKLVIWSIMLLVSAVNWRSVVGRCCDPVVGLLALFVCVGILSSTYSVVPAYSAACALSLAAYLGFACLLAGEFGQVRLVQILLWAMAGYLVLNWTITIFWPEIGFMEGHDEAARLQGVSGHPNSLARQANVFVCLAIGAFYRGLLSRRAFWSSCVLGGSTVIATDSRTAVISLLVPLILVALQSRRFLLPGTLILALGAAVAAQSIDLSEFSRSGSGEEVLTLTGRTELWSFVMQEIAKHPLIGHGFSSFEATVVDQWYGNPDAGVATHNNFLEIIYSCGIFGFIPFGGALAILLARWLKCPNVLYDLFLLDMLVTSCTEVDISLVVLPTLVWFILLALDDRPGFLTSHLRRSAHV